nr:hypothetical protein [Tanacetum cinerariifolium]
EILNICPRIPGQELDEPPTKEEAISFICELGHSREIKYITDVIVDHLHQPWRTFASIINKCLCGKDTANSGGKKETKGIVFHQMDTEEVSNRFVAPCFVNGLEAYDGKINLGVEENMISNEYAVKLCLEHEFIINPKEDDVEPRVIFGRSFQHIEKEEKSPDDWDDSLDFNLDDVPQFKEELLLFVCKMRKSNRNKKRAMENLNFFYRDIRTSSLAGGHLTQEEAAKEALAIRISQTFTLLEKVRPVIEIIAYHDKYKKVLNEIWKEKVELDEKIVKEEEEAIKKVRVTTIISKFLILDIPIDRDVPIVTMGTHDDEVGSSISKHPRQYETMEEVLLPQIHHEFLLWEGCSREAKFRYNTKLANLLPRHIYSPCMVNWDILHEMGCDGEINDMLRIRLRETVSNEEIFTFVAWLWLYQAVELDEEGFNVYFEGEEAISFICELGHSGEIKYITDVIVDHLHQPWRTFASIINKCRCGKDTANSGGKKETKGIVFHQMDTKEVSNRFVEPCFVNGLEVYDGKINLGVEENMISNEYAVKLCLEHEVGRGNKVVKKELIIVLRDIEKKEKSPDDWDDSLDFNLDDVPQFKEELPSFVCKKRKSNPGDHLTQEEKAKEALAIRISQKFTLLEKVRPVIKIIAYHDKYKKVLNEIWKEKVELDEKIVKEEEEAIKKG